jgi:hypothetical protein
MARKKKSFFYEFADGEREIPSSYKAKCTITGEIVPIYHKFLETLIKKHYKNSFSLFEKTYAQKDAIKKKKEDEGYNENDKHTLNAYSDYLIICYRSCINNLEGNFNKQAIVRYKNEMIQIADNFKKHFNRDIAKFV